MAKDIIDKILDSIFDEETIGEHGEKLLECCAFLQRCYRTFHGGHTNEKNTQTNHDPACHVELSLLNEHGEDDTEDD